MAKINQNSLPPTSDGEGGRNTMLWTPISGIMEPVSHVLVCQIPAVPGRSEQRSQQGHCDLSAGQLQPSTAS